MTIEKETCRIPISIALLAVAVTSALAASIAYSLGGELGFIEGYLEATYEANSRRGEVAARALTAFRKGQESDGFEMLELVVDYSLLGYPDFAEAPDARFGIFDSRDHVAVIFRRTAEYRREYPSPAPPAGRQSEINETVDLLIRDVNLPSCDACDRRHNNSLNQTTF